jgi:rsbT co-antagonist protein RsbR
LLASLLYERREQVLDAWVQAQARKLERRSGRRPDADVRAECEALLDALQSAVASDSIDVKSPEYVEVTRLVDFMSKDRARQGYSPTETAIAVFSLKDSLLGVLEEVCGDEPELLVGEIKKMNALGRRPGAADLRGLHGRAARRSSSASSSRCWRCRRRW